MPAPPMLATAALATAGLAYLNARGSLWYDALMARSIAGAAIPMFWRARFGGKINVFYQVEKRAKDKKTADRPFILFGDKSYSYAAVYDRALRFGTWWRERMGVREKDIVAMDFMNSDNFIFLWLGLWAIGAKPAFINYNLKDKPLIHCVKAAGAKLMIVDTRVADAIDDNVRASLSDVRIEFFTLELEAEILAMDPVRYPDSVREEDKVENLAILIYTSGTTGLPKAAVVSWAKVIVGGGLTSGWLQTRPDDIYYTCMPLYHSTASILCFGNVLASGATMAIGVRFSNKTFWSDVRKHKATIIQYVGETCRYLLAAPPDIDPVTGENLDKKHNVRIAAGNGLRPDIWNRFKERFGIEAIGEFYALTEGSMGAFNISKNDFGMGAVGRNGKLYDWTLGFNVTLVEIDHTTELPYRDPKTGRCKKVKAGEPGEFIFRLPPDNIESRFQGYYGNKEATDSKIMRDVFRKGDAWFRTGDVMRWDSDGRMFFHDRIGDTFRWKSENVSTMEVQQVVGLHPEVQDANVYGVQVPHHDGRAGCVAVAFAKGPNREVLSSLARHVSAGLPRYALPMFLRIVRGAGAHSTGTNKQQKHLLRQQGVTPEEVEGDQLFWLRDGLYEPFGPKEWEELNGGLVRL